MPLVFSSRRQVSIPSKGKTTWNMMIPTKVDYFSSMANEAYRAGYAAGASGCQYNSNPYKESNEVWSDRDCWQLGWEDGYHAR